MAGSLAEIVKDSLTIASPVINSAVTALLTTVFLRRNTGAAEYEKLKHGKFGEVIDTLLESGKMTYLEYYKSRNFLQVAKLADEAAEDTASQNGEPFSFDWFMRFFDAVGNISDQDLQRLWGQVLADEIARPKSCSLRTLDMIRNMSPEEAQSFTALSKYVLCSGDSQYIAPIGFHDRNDGYTDCNDHMEQAGLSAAKDVIPLLELGALSGDRDLAIYLGKGDKLAIHNEKILCIAEGISQEKKLLQQDAYFLTASGMEMFQIVKKMPGYKADTDYATLCFRQMKLEHPEFEISAYKVLEFGEEGPECDWDNLLTD